MASPGSADADTFPKLLIRNARSFGNRPAMRHKDLGIWQTLTWAQLLDEVRAYATGLYRLGLRRGDTMAIVGANRPRLYASVMAAQTLGVIPVPVYADAVASSQGKPTRKQYEALAKPLDKGYRDAELLTSVRAHPSDYLGEPVLKSRGKRYGVAVAVGRHATLGKSAVYAVLVFATPR